MAAHLDHAPHSIRVSVLIDSYESRPFIAETVDSVLGQTHPADEIIVSDDGSRDGTCEFLRDRYGARITVLSAPPLPGRTVLARQAASISHAFAHSYGDIVFLLDGDDIFLPERIAQYLAVFAARPDVVMVQSPLRHIDAAGNPLAWTPKAIASADDLLAAVYRRHDLDCFYSTSSLGFRRSLLTRVLPLDVSDGIKVWTDDRLGIAALVSGPVVTLPEVSGCWRRHGRSITAGLFRQRAFLARLAWNRARIFNRSRRGTGLKPLAIWRSGRFYLRWLRVLLGGRRVRMMSP